LRQEPVETKANQCADPIRKNQPTKRITLKRKIDKWYNHHKISNKNITKGEIPTALKNTQRNGPLKKSKKKRVHKHLKKINKKTIIKSNFCVQKSKLNSI
jgi:hypothetical protein